MNPEELSVKGTESGHQKGLFAWAAMARMYGISVADNMDAYNPAYFNTFNPVRYPINSLAWLHSIPNGGERNARTAALMKAEGARSGVGDVFLPVPKYAAGQVVYCGLYIEMKKPKPDAGRQSDEQKEFEAHCNANHYVYRLCYTWREAADTIVEYLGFK